MLLQPAYWWTASLTPQTTRTASASGCFPTSTAIQRSKIPGDTLAKVCPECHSRSGRLKRFNGGCFCDLTSCVSVHQECTCTTSGGRCTQSASVTPASLCRAETVITITASIPPLSARSPVDVALRFSTTRSLLSFWHSQSTTALRPCMSSLRCAPLG